MDTNASDAAAASPEPPSSLESRVDDDDDDGGRRRDSDVGGGTPDAGGGGGEHGNVPGAPETGGRVLTVLLACMQHVATGGFGGLCMEYTSVAFPSFRDDPRTFLLTEFDVSGIVSAFYAGTIIGFFLGGFIAERYSKKIFLMTSYVPMTISWVPFMFVTNVPLMIMARVLQGVMYGARSNVSFAYVMEIADARSRNWGISTYALAIGVGALLAAVMGAFLRWDVIAMICAAVGASFVPLTIGMPDTPIHWLRRDKLDEAKSSLRTYRVSSHDVDKEIKDLTEYLHIGKEGFAWRRIYQKKYAWPLAKTVVLNILKPWCGYPALVGYTVEILRRVQLSGPIRAELANIVIQGFDFVAQFISTFIVSYVSRKIQMGVGCLAMALASGLNGLYSHAVAKEMARSGEIESALLRNLSTWWPIIGLSIWFSAYSLGMANALHLVMGEMLPNKVVNFGIAVCFVVLTINQFLLTQLFYTLINMVKIHGVFWIFASSALTLSILSLLIVEDTRNKSLLELERTHHGHGRQKPRQVKDNDDGSSQSGARQRPKRALSSTENTGQE